MWKFELDLDGYMTVASPVPGPTHPHKHFLLAAEIKLSAPVAAIINTVVTVHVRVGSLHQHIHLV